VNVGWYNGCFDLFHDGHRFALRECQRQCDWLVLGVNTDASIRRLKGPLRPMDDLQTRMSAIRHFVRQHETPVAIVPFEGQVDPLLMHIRPDILFVGYDHKVGRPMYRKIGWKDDYAGSQWEGPKVIQLEHLPGHSTTLQIQQGQKR
jgi:D-beta-D-heptose 7-phosphate kinase/D-beta-D-heptose 1-phosphate adenosyltransferase